MDNIVSASKAKIGQFVSGLRKKLTDQEGFIQRNPQTGRTYVNFGQQGNQIARPIVQGAVRAFNPIKTFVETPFKALETRSPEIIQAAGTGTREQKLLQAFPKATEIVGQEFGRAFGGRVGAEAGKLVGIGSSILGKPIPQLGAGIAQIVKGQTKEGLGNVAMGGVGALLTSAGLAGGGILAAGKAVPKLGRFVLGSAALGGAFGGGAKALENYKAGRPLTEGLFDAIGRQAAETGARSVTMFPILKLTQPLIAGIGYTAQRSLKFNKLPDSLKAQVLDRVLASTLGVAEGLVLDKALGLKTDALSIGVDAATNAIFGTGARALSPAQKRAITMAIKNQKIIFENAVQTAYKTLRDERGFAKLDEPIGGKAEPQYEAQIKVFVTKQDKQQLLDLGYKREQISKMKPSEVQDILSGKTTQQTKFQTQTDVKPEPAIKPILTKDGKIKVQTTTPEVKPPDVLTPKDEMTSIGSIMGRMRDDILKTWKSKEELQAKYPQTKRIKVEGSELKNKLINAFKNQSPKTFNLDKANTALSYVTNKIPEKKLNKIINESGINANGKKSIENFWNLVRKELSKNPSYKEDYDAIWKSLLDSEPYFNSKIEGQVNVKAKKIPITEDIDVLKTFPSKKEVYGKQAEKLLKDFVTHGNSLVDRIVNGIKYYKLGKKEFIRYIENPDTFPESIKDLIDAHKYLMDVTRTARENPNLGKIEFYYPHMNEADLVNRQDIKRIGDDLWISSTNMKLGTAQKRKGVMLNYSQDYEKVMKSYMEQAGYEKYGKRLNYDERTQNFVNKLDEHLVRNEEGILERPNTKFDYIEESRIRQNIAEPKPIFARFIATDTFDSIRRKIERDPNGKKLADVMAVLRDADDQINNFIKESEGKDLKTQLSNFKRIDTVGRNIIKERDKLGMNELLMLGNYEKAVRLQRFVDAVGEHKFEEPLANYLKLEIDRLTKKGEYEQDLATSLSSFMTGLAYRAQIWFNVNTALLQKSEVIRLPVLYNPKVIADGARQYAQDIRTGRDILKQYDFNGLTADQTKFLGDENVLINGKFGKLKQFGKNVDEVTGKFGNFLVNLTENSKNRDFLYTIEAQGKELGLEGSELYRFVRNEMFANSFILHEFNTPQIIKNPLFRVLLQYMQYPIKMYSRAWELGTTNPNKIKGVAQAGALIGTQGIAAILLAYITGKSLEKLNETFTDAMSLRFGPVPTTLFNLAKSAKELYDNENDQDKTDEQKQNTKEYIENQAKRYLISLTIPGSNQWRKTTGALSVINRGYDETYGGNITYPAPDNRFDEIRGLLFGKTSFPENQEYYQSTQNVTDFGGRKLQQAYSIGGNEFSKEKADVIRELFKQGKAEEGKKVIELERRVQKARKESYDALSDIEKAALNSIPKQEPDDVQARMSKYRTMLDYPAIYDKKKFDAIVASNGDVNKIDPLYTYNYEDARKYMMYQAEGGSILDDKNADAIFDANPVVLEISKARSVYFKNNPIEALDMDSLRPLASARAQALMSQGIWNDSEVQAYLQANTQYKNMIRAKMGYPLIDQYGNIAGQEDGSFARFRGGSRGGVKTKKAKKVGKITVKKGRVPKGKGFKIRKLKTPKIKEIKTPRLKVLPKTKRQKIKVKTPKFKVKINA